MRQEPLFATTLLGVAFVGLVITTHARASFIINGDFEDKTAMDTEYNLTTAKFGSTLSDVSAEVGGIEFDLISEFDLGIEADDGAGKFGLDRHNRTHLISGAFSFDLTEAITTGNECILEFFVARLEGFQAGEVRIELSNVATDFAAPNLSGVPVSSIKWMQLVHEFVAPTDAGFPMVRTEGVGNMCVSWDRCGLVPEPKTVSSLVVGSVMATPRRGP